MFWKILLSNKFGFILETSLFSYYAECHEAQLIAIIFASNISQKLGIKGRSHNTLFFS
jgi:hypothetical protein